MCNYNPIVYFGYKGYCDASDSSCMSSSKCRKCRNKKRARWDRDKVKYCPCWAKQEGKIKRCRGRF